MEKRNQREAERRKGKIEWNRERRRSIEEEEWNKQKGERTKKRRNKEESLKVADLGWSWLSVVVELSTLLLLPSFSFSCCDARQEGMVSLVCKCVVPTLHITMGADLHRSCKIQVLDRVDFMLAKKWIWESRVSYIPSLKQMPGEPRMMTMVMLVHHQRKEL